MRRGCLTPVRSSLPSGSSSEPTRTRQFKNCLLSPRRFRRGIMQRCGDGAPSSRRGGSLPLTAVLALPVGAFSSWLASVASLCVPGPVSRPIGDRWAQKSTPVTGGFGLLAGFVIALAVATRAGHLAWASASGTSISGTRLCARGQRQIRSQRPARLRSACESGTGIVHARARCSALYTRRVGMCSSDLQPWLQEAPARLLTKSPGVG